MVVVIIDSRINTTIYIVIYVVTVMIITFSKKENKKTEHILCGRRLWAAESPTDLTGGLSAHVLWEETKVGRGTNIPDLRRAENDN